MKLNYDSAGIVPENLVLKISLLVWLVAVVFAKCAPGSGAMLHNGAHTKGLAEKYAEIRKSAADERVRIQKDYG